MTGDSLTPEQPPSGPLYARQSDETPTAGTQRGEGGASGAQTGAESRDPRLRAYAAVFAYIQQLPAETTYLDPVTRNAVIWRAVHAALDVTDPEHEQSAPAAARREQLPDDVLALLSPYPYLSAACETGRRVDAATIRHPERADLPDWVERLHRQCPLTHKFTGDPCNCRCHRPTA